MDVSYEWLKELVDVPVSPEELGDKVSVTGIEVPSVTYRGAGMKNIVIGHVLSTKPHPDSDHLVICQVDVGEDEPRQIICGAPNVAAGQTVIAALPGARIADNAKIKRGKIRGEVSDGMLCALQEIGFPDTLAPHKYADGIYVFQEAIKPGTDALEVLGMKDAILDFDITPNRADILGMRGVAWEVGATYGNKPHFSDPTLTEDGPDVNTFLKSNVENDEDTMSYNLRVVTNVKVGESPLWLQKRLWNAGVKPHNNIVDITNYIMEYYGQPMHAYDYDKLTSKEIDVRRAKAGEKVTTLDGSELDLVNSDLVITDGNKPVGLAGVMGGLNSEISDSTTTVVFEAAMFNHRDIRKTAQRYNLHSAASTRFERGIDKASIVPALNAAAAMAADLADATVAKGVISASTVDSSDVVVKASLARINKVLGTQIGAAEVADIFDRLGFGVKTAAHGDDTIYTVNVPARRWDISIVPDLIEEVARLYGYDKLPSTLPTTTETIGLRTPAQERIRRSRHQLEGMGLSQAMTYALRKEGDDKHFALENSMLTTLAWPMSSDHQFLRENLISGLLDAVSYNVARGENDVFLYEQARVFIRQNDEQRPAEHEYLSGVLTGNMQPASWNHGAKPVDFFMVKGIVEKVLDDYNTTGSITYSASELDDAMHPGQSASIYLDGERIGLLGRLHPAFEAREKLPETYIFELNLEPLLTAAKNDVVAVPAAKFPSVTRDIALLVDQDVTSEQIIDVIRANGGKYLEDVHVFDLYAGPHLPNNAKSLAYTLTYLNRESTLTEDVVEKAFAKVKAALKEELHAVIR